MENFLVLVAVMKLKDNKLMFKECLAEKVQDHITAKLMLLLAKERKATNMVRIHQHISSHLQSLNSMQQRNRTF